MSLSLRELQEWDDRIRVLVDRFGLQCYPQEFEICDHNEMLGYMAYSGMPSHYSHWSYGKNFERQKTMYDYGASGLPYEMVINTNPCIAYLMRDNTDLLQILTIAHVYGHNDFFANNFTFIIKFFNLSCYHLAIYILAMIASTYNTADCSGVSDGRELRIS